ncbi:MULTISPECIES: hypothetical protein [unclassified Archaeoglobus]|uniref:hypothetical protein n=1 Tax=unclassified Archaeoglobus TaxID=2643606 RepID=UPI0025BB5E1B|nr:MULTISPECIES: hypothetical protein [unclassified Archaeoglobus]
MKGLEVIEELLEIYDSTKFDSETSELLEKLLSRAVLKYMFLQEEMDEEVKIALQVVKKFIS